MKHIIKSACFVCSSALFLPQITIAEVKSLTSSELTETYIKDSTIIVTPKKKEAPLSQKKVYSNLTIAPVESDELDIEQLQQADQHNSGTQTSYELTDDLLRDNSVTSAVFPLEEVDIPTYQERTTLPVADILDDERYRVPEGDFDMSFLGEQGVGLSRSGDQLTFSIGTPAGVPNPIEIPQALNEGPVNIVPRAGGGFDLTINIPQDN